MDKIKQNELKDDQLEKATGGKNGAFNMTCPKCGGAMTLVMQDRDGCCKVCKKCGYKEDISL